MEDIPKTPLSTPPLSSPPSPNLNEKFVAFEPPSAPFITVSPEIDKGATDGNDSIENTPEKISSKDEKTPTRKPNVDPMTPITSIPPVSSSRSVLPVPDLGKSRRRSSLSPSGSPRRSSFISLTPSDETVIFSDSDNASQSSAASEKRPRKRTLKKKVRKSLDTESRPLVRIDPSDALGTGYTLVPATGKIFRNLLILEDNLRQQVNQQKHLRRKYLIFLACLCSLTASISHHLFLVDSTPTGTKRVVLQFTLLALLVTLMLYHLSGEYQKTIVVPRKFLSSTNKGLRQMNVRLVKIKTAMSDSLVDLIREFGLFIGTMCLSSLHKVYPLTFQNKGSKLEVFFVSCQVYCQARVGINDVKLVLNSRAFNIDVREGWELYRSEFWIHEGVRRRKNLLAFTQKKEKRRKSIAKLGSLSPGLLPGVLPKRIRSPSPKRLSERNLKSLEEAQAQESEATLGTQ